MTASPAFRVAQADYAADLPALRAVREAVFVEEQRVPRTLELDPMDPLCTHVLARDAQGQPIGTGRLTPERRIGRMAVLPTWRGQGVGAAMLEALTGLARMRGLDQLELHAQLSALPFYARHGYLPVGPQFMEAGIAHQSMHRKLAGAAAIESRDGAIATVSALAWQARRRLCIYSRALDPGLFDAAATVEALRRLAVRGGGVEIRVLLHDAATPQREHAPLLALAQRLPSVLLLREVDDPVERGYPSAYVANDAGGYYFRGQGHRFDGAADLSGAGRARQLCAEFDRAWERARACPELRALGL